MLILIILLAAGSLSGCLTTKAASRIQEYHAEGVEDARQITRRMLDDWLFRSGVIRGALKPRMQELPTQAVKALDDLDILARQNLTGELDDYELGLFLGTRMRLLSNIVRDAVETYAPSVLAYVPF